MRLSALPHSPYYREEMIRPVARIDHGEVKIRYEPVAVYVDGIRQTACVEACEDEGWADIYLFDDQGHQLLDAAFLVRTPLVERVRGLVEIRRLPPVPPGERKALEKGAIQRMQQRWTIQ